MPGDTDKVVVVWEQRLEVETGVSHWAAELHWNFHNSAQTSLLGYQTRCTPITTMIHDEIIYETIPPDSPLAEQVTCIGCLAREP